MSFFVSQSTLVIQLHLFKYFFRLKDTWARSRLVGPPQGPPTPPWPLPWLQQTHNLPRRRCQPLHGLPVDPPGVSVGGLHIRFTTPQSPTSHKPPLLLRRPRRRIRNPRGVGVDPEIARGQTGTTQGGSSIMITILNQCTTSRNIPFFLWFVIFFAVFSLNLCFSSYFSSFVWSKFNRPLVDQEI